MWPALRLFLVYALSSIHPNDFEAISTNFNEHNSNVRAVLAQSV